MRRLARSEVREIDRLAIEHYGLAGIVLMENAGAGAARLLLSHGVAGPIAIACGRGNNGGDGFVIARHLDAAGHRVRVLLAADPDGYRGDAAANLRVAERSGIPIECLAGAEASRWSSALAGASWIVDALLGTGAMGAPRTPLTDAIVAINAARDARRDATGMRVLAVDLPSGLDADTGEAPGACVRADITATFVAEKLGFANPAAANFTGRVSVNSIGVPACLLRQFGVGGHEWAGGHTTL